MATDLYEGLAEVSDVFVGTTLTALDALQQLHTYLLIATVVVFVAVVLVLLVPFRNRLMTESLRLAGLLSQLPQVRSKTSSTKNPWFLHNSQFGRGVWGWQHVGVLLHRLYRTRTHDLILCIGCLCCYVCVCRRVMLRGMSRCW